MFSITDQRGQAAGSQFVFVVVELIADELVEHAHAQHLDRGLVVRQDAVSALIGRELRVDRAHHIGIVAVLELCDAAQERLLPVIRVRAEDLGIRVAPHRRGDGVLEDTRHRVAEVFVDRAVLRGRHVEVHDHHAVRLQMCLHFIEKLDARELERDGDILIGVHHDDVKLLLRRGKVRAPVLDRDGHAAWKSEVVRRDVGNFFVDLRALHTRAGEIARAVARVRARAHAEDHHAAVFVVRAVHARHAGRGERVVIVHARQRVALDLHALHTEEHVRRERRALRVVLHLQIVVDGLVLKRDVALPEGEAVRRQGKAQSSDQKDGDDPRHALFLLEHEVRDADGREHTGEDQKRCRRADGGDRHKRRHEGSDDAADGVERVEPAHGLARVVEIVDREARERRRDGAEQHAREREDHKARRERRPDEEVFRHKKRQQQRDARDQVPSHKRDERDPDGRDDEAAVELIGRRALVGELAAPDVADGHRDHNDADDNGPHDLRRAEVRGHEPARTELDRHDGHTGKKFGQV